MDDELEFAIASHGFFILFSVHLLSFFIFFSLGAKQFSLLLILPIKTKLIKFNFIQTIDRPPQSKQGGAQDCVLCTVYTSRLHQ